MSELPAMPVDRKERRSLRITMHLTSHLLKRMIPEATCQGRDKDVINLMLPNDTCIPEDNHAEKVDRPPVQREARPYQKDT
ncbi:hypothetical protein AMTR_s00145p00068020 [Amborella trichopoda]|uniref:Uncharacterized protein n=1 Tax=Amborella trichopoda TaxID=13333 RepID=W1PE05_AMBTC|nr:hypothetical protein AMTR_s00145p00068020 [Amborella trichopoda]